MEETAKKLLQCYALEWIECLGKGGFGTVHKARCLRSDAIVAVKLINKSRMKTSNMAKRIVNEVTLHIQLKHPYIVELLDFFEGKGYVFLVMECCPRGDVYHHMKRSGKLSEEHSRKISHQLLCALAHLHSRNIMHRDLKLSNILIAEDWSIRIADFGLSVQLRTIDEEHYTICGTPNYIAPEIASQQAHTLSADMWSAGCLIFTLMTGSSPFKHDKPVYHRQSHRRPGKIVMNPKFRARLERLPELAQDLIRSLLQREPANRLTAEEALQHPFFVKQDPVLTPIIHETPPPHPMKSIPENKQATPPSNEDSNATKESEVLLEWVKDDQVNGHDSGYTPPEGLETKQSSPPPAAAAFRGYTSLLPYASNPQPSPYKSRPIKPALEYSPTAPRNAPVYPARSQQAGSFWENETPTVMRPGIVIGNAVGVESPPNRKRRVRAEDAFSEASSSNEPSLLRAPLMRIPGEAPPPPPPRSTAPSPPTTATLSNPPHATPSLHHQARHTPPRRAHKEEKPAYSPASAADSQLSTSPAHAAPPPTMSWSVNTPSRATAPAIDHSGFDHSDTTLQVSSMTDRSPGALDASPGGRGTVHSWMQASGLDTAYSAHLSGPGPSSYTVYPPPPGQGYYGLLYSPYHDQPVPVPWPPHLRPQMAPMYYPSTAHTPSSQPFTPPHIPYPPQAPPFAAPAADPQSLPAEPRKSESLGSRQLPASPQLTPNPPPPSSSAAHGAGGGTAPTPPSLPTETHAAPPAGARQDAHQREEGAPPRRSTSEAQVSPLPPPRSSASTRPCPPFNSYFVKARKMKTKQATVVIDSLGFVHARFAAFPVRLRISPDGEDILVADGTLKSQHEGTRSSASLPSNTSTPGKAARQGTTPRRYSSYTLPRRYSKLYRYLASVVNVLKSQTPIVKVVATTSMCAMMANSPLPDFRYAHAAGWRLKYLLQDRVIHFESPSGWCFEFSVKHASDSTALLQSLRCSGWKQRSSASLMRLQDIVAALPGRYPSPSALEDELKRGADVETTLKSLVLVAFSRLREGYRVWQRHITELVRAADAWWKQEKARSRSKAASAASSASPPAVPVVVSSDVTNDMPKEADTWVTLAKELDVYASSAK